MWPVDIIIMLTCLCFEILKLQLMLNDLFWKIILFDGLFLSLFYFVLYWMFGLLKKIYIIILSNWNQKAFTVLMLPTFHLVLHWIIITYQLIRLHGWTFGATQSLNSILMTSLWSASLSCKVFNYWAVGFEKQTLSLVQSSIIHPTHYVSSQ